MDALWMEHLENMEHLRGSVNLRAYGQRDPLVEYRREGLRLFKEMEKRYEELVEKITKNPSPQSPSPLGRAGGGVAPVGRNDLCPCGSGKKYKKCHGQ
jgi:preprotein translocase subunit SecA